MPSGGVFFDGGSQADMDSMVLSGNRVPFARAVFTYTTTDAEGHDGFIDLDGARIDFEGLEPINAGNATDAVLNLPVGFANDAVLRNSANAGEIEIVDNGVTFEDTILPNPTSSLTVNLGDQGDLLSVEALDPGFSATLFVNGGAGADQVDGSASTVPLRLAGGGGNDVLTGSTLADTIADGDGDDSLDGGGGADLYRLTPGSADVISDSSGDDTADFSSASGGVTFDLDAAGAQVVFGVDTVEIVGLVESFVGGPSANSVDADALAGGIARDLDGGAGGGTLRVDAMGAEVTDTGTELQFDGGQGTIAYRNWDAVLVENAFVPPAIEIPSLGPWGLFALLVLLAIGSVARLRRTETRRE